MQANPPYALSPQIAHTSESPDNEPRPKEAVDLASTEPRTTESV